MHAKGYGAARHCQTAVGYYRIVLETASTKSIPLWKEAFENYKKGNYQAALIYYLYLADLGFDIAQLNAADIIAAKKSLIEEDHNDFMKRAKFNWERASQDGNSVASQAILNLGDYYFYEEKNYEKAVERYRLNSDRYDCPRSSFNLGYMHHYGIGLPKDHHLAKRYYDKTEETDKDSAIPVLLALTKLFADLALSTFSKKLSNFNLQLISDYLYAIEYSNLSEVLETYLIAYLGLKYDIILGVCLLFLAIFGLAWRRHNRAIYDRQRMDEILRLEQIAEEEEAAILAEEAEGLVEDVQNNKNEKDKNEEQTQNQENTTA